jgi:hypothetical protein
MKRIKEGYKGVHKLFFNAVENEDGSYEIVFLKGKPGNNVAEGFAFDDPAVDTWSELEEFFLRPEMAPFWLERNGFHVQKYFAFMARFWYFLPDVPKLSEMNISGKLSLPDFQERIEKTFDIKPDAWENY